ncbi:MAG: TraB/GumN family protein [Paracoccaceae bacterium]
MLKAIVATFFVLAASQGAEAACAGRNLLETMPTEELAALREATDRHVHAQGNFWRATRGAEVIHILGTYHVDDPRHDAAAERLAPYIEASDTVLVEAGPEEYARLQSEIARDPSLVFMTDGPTLPELLGEADWQALSKALGERNIPAFMASKMRPWFIAGMLSIPPCAKENLEAASNGLDARVIARAVAADIPVRALEPYDAVFGVFDKLGIEQQLDMIRATLLVDSNADDQSATMSDIYFAEDARAIWEMGRLITHQVTGKPQAEVDADFALIEEALVNGRNRAWIPLILDAAQDGQVFAAFGALHLSGSQGVLQLLENEGFTLERLPF